MVLTTVRSHSNPALSYEIRLGKDGKVYCICPSWKFSSGKPCKHLKSLEVR